MMIKICGSSLFAPSMYICVCTRFIVAIVRNTLSSLNTFGSSKQKFVFNVLKLFRFLNRSFGAMPILLL